MKALLVIDIDHMDDWKPQDLEYLTRKQISENIKGILKLERDRGNLIVFVILITSGSAVGQEAQYNLGNLDVHQTSRINLPQNGCLGCDIGDEWRLAEFLEHRHGSEPVFIKRAQNAFENKKLEKYLREKGITELELIGCNTDQCVRASAAGALKAGFKVTLLAKSAYPPIIKSGADKSWWIKDVKRLAKLATDAHAQPLIDVAI